MNKLERLAGMFGNEVYGLYHNRKNAVLKIEPFKSVSKFGRARK